MNSEPRVIPTRRCLGAALSVAFLLTATLAPGCKQPEAKSPPAPERAEVQKTATASAKVVSVDKNTRIIVLRKENGEQVRVRCGEEVRNFAQIAAGDTVRVDYHTSLAVELKKPGEESPPLSVDAAAGRAPVGATPAAAAGAQVTVTVRIESVDLQRNIVVFTPPSGELTATEVVRPEGREFIRGLKPGDRVQITYTEAAAIKVEKQ